MSLPIDMKKELKKIGVYRKGDKITIEADFGVYFGAESVTITLSRVPDLIKLLEKIKEGKNGGDP